MPAGLNEKAPSGLLLAAFGASKFGFSALLLFGQLFETLAITLGDFPKLIVFYFIVMLFVFGYFWATNEE